MALAAPQSPSTANCRPASVTTWRSPGGGGSSSSLGPSSESSDARTAPASGDAAGAVRAEAALACRAVLGYGALGMEQGKTTDPAAMLAELREQVRGLDERVEALGRHL